MSIATLGKNKIYDGIKYIPLENILDKIILENPDINPFEFANIFKSYLKDNENVYEFFLGYENIVYEFKINSINITYYIKGEGFFWINGRYFF